MKRFICVLFALCLFCTACTRQPDTNIQDTPSSDPIVPESTPTAESVTPEYTQLPMFAVSVPAITDYAYNEASDVIFSHSYQNMRLVLQDPEVADKIIVDFLQRIEQTLPQAQIVYDAALDCEEVMPIPYSFSMLYNPTRIDQAVLSLCGMQTSWAGGIHPNYACTAANYNMVTGDVLTLGSILESVNAIDPLHRLILAELEAIEESHSLFPGYEEIVHDRLFDEESYYEDWYFSSSGLCFFFSPYEIAPYASGTITIEIPYTSLTGIIGDSFFPPEKNIGSGVVNALRMDDTQLDQFTQIAEVTIDQGGEMVFLYTEQAVYDIRIDVGHWDEEGLAFTPDYTALAAYSLTPGDAIMVETYIPDVLPNLRLTYASGEETVTVYLHQSGMDGSIFLSEE